MESEPNHNQRTAIVPEARLRMLWINALCCGLVLSFLIQAVGADETNPRTTHWAFEPVPAVSEPAVKRSDWAKTPVDRFILAKLEKSGLSPAPPAEKRRLIRRATFDLTGLPPTPEEIENFLADKATNAFDRVVERLLESPHYGERWGRHWLDVARYADNKGYVFFEEKNYPWAWTYRDYVVRSFNEDKPYTQFVKEQLAADELNVKGETGRLAALGFLTVGDHFSNNTHDIIDDRIDVVTRGLLGLTVSCARCHDHKFDPISAADYYSLYGVFRSSKEPMVLPLIETPEPSEDYEYYELELMARERRLREFVERKHGEIVQGARTNIAGYLMGVFADRHQPPTEDFMLITDQGDLHPTVIARWRVLLGRAGEKSSIWMPWLKYSALDQTNFTAEAAVEVEAAIAAADFLNPRVTKAFAGTKPKSMKEVAEIYAGVLGEVQKQWEEVRSASERTPKRLLDPADEELRKVLYGEDAPPEVPAEMDWGFLSLLPDRPSQGEFEKLLKSLEHWLVNGPAAPARAMVLQDAERPYQPRIFQRGNPNRPGEPVERKFLALLDKERRPFKQGSGRLELAEAICDPGNPLTARVFVNRVWMHHFGRGLVSTPSDFGTRSEPPSHPELLDWLAGEFVRSGWSVKQLHRMIMKSAVYQQSSEGSAEGARLDPENRWFWRMNRRRHNFETQRDALLAVAGKLDRKTGGAPEGLESSRRTIYKYIDRLDVPPVRTTFDFPSPSTSCPMRAETTVSPQALYFMNNEFLAQAAEGLVKRDDVSGLKESDRKVERMYALAYGRIPGESELARAREFLGSEPNEKVWIHFAHALLMANEFVFVD